MSMDAVIYFVGLPLLGYIAGATPFGFLAGKAKGVDIRKHGSGNIGATNVLRILGKPIGVSVFLADFLKGALPVLLSVYLVGRDGVPLQAFGRDVVPVFVALATILGHNFTFWLGFKGGKGVATSAGALVALMPGGWTSALPLSAAQLLQELRAAANLPAKVPTAAQVADKL